MTDELQSVERRLALFAMSMLEISWAGSNAGGDEIQEEAVRLGLVEMVPFDPVVHNDPSGAAEAGDDYFDITKDLRGILDETRPDNAQSEPDTKQGERDAV